MSRLDRAVHRIRQHLDRDEGLLASAMGLELEGRRHRVVVVTDRRVVVGWRRGTPPDVLSMTTTGTYHREEGRLELVDGDQVVVLRDVDRHEAERVVGVLGRRHRRPLPDRLGDGNHIRIVAG